MNKLTKKAVFLVLFFGSVILAYKNWNTNDFRVGYITDDSVSIVSFSSKRKMVNTLTAKKGDALWVPSGPGWHDAGNVARLCKNDDVKTESCNWLFNYNWGYDPDLVLITEINRPTWDRDLFKKINKWGFVNYFFYLVSHNEWTNRTNEISNVKDAELLTDLLIRDFADADLVMSEIRLSIHNGSTVNGLGSFVADVFEKAGVVVVGVDNRSAEGVNKCKLVVGDEVVTKKRLFDVLNSIVPGCDIETGGDRNWMIDLFLSDDYAEMIDYESYKE